MVAEDDPLDLLGQDGGDAVAAIGGVRGEESLDGGELGITDTSFDLVQTGRMLRPITASDPCGGVERTRVVVERHLAILAGKDESERKRRVPG